METIGKIYVSSHDDYWGDVTAEEAEAAAYELADRIRETFPEFDVKVCAGFQPNPYLYNPDDDDLKLEGIRHYIQETWHLALETVVVPESEEGGQYKCAWCGSDSVSANTSDGAIGIYACEGCGKYTDAATGGKVTVNALGEKRAVI